MVTGIVVPMPSERKPLERALGRGRDDVLVVQSGIGAERAAAATVRLLEAGAERVLVCGIAGGIPGAVEVGDLVVPAVVEDGATGERFEPTPIGAVELRGLLRTAGLDSFASTEADAAALREAGVVAVDMETAAVGRVCAEHGVPWLAFRGISDLVGDASIGEPVMTLVDADGSPRPGAAAAFFLRHPRRLPRFVRLWRDAATAAQRAAEATVQLT